MKEAKNNLSSEKEETNVLDLGDKIEKKEILERLIWVISLVNVF